MVERWRQYTRLPRKDVNETATLELNQIYGEGGVTVDLGVFLTVGEGFGGGGGSVLSTDGEGFGVGDSR